MSIQVEVKTRNVTVTCRGALRARDAREGAEAVWVTPGWSGQPIVWDFRGAQFDLSSAEIRDIAHFVLRGQPIPPPARVAFVTGRDVDFGMSRMFGAYRDDPRTEFRVLRDYKKAIRWAQGDEPGAA